jgi:hypothetical protein
MTQCKWQQTKLNQYNPPPQNHKTNISLAGDPLQEQEDNDGYTRFGFQNIRGSSIDSRLEIATEIDNMINIGTDLQDLYEINRPWTHTNKWKYNFMMEAVFQQSPTVYALSPTDRTNTYQPGGNLLSITRDNVGQINNTGKDIMGQFTWATMRGKLDDGILIIVAYRVCQDHNSRAGAFMPTNNNILHYKHKANKDQT